MISAGRVSRRSFLAAAAALSSARAQSLPPRPRRQDCFLGMHFDLHPGPSDQALGRDLTEEMVARFLDRVKPDYVQYDCKGHAGWLGYPSNIGPSAPNIVKDSLEIWRRVTARRGVGLYIHFSGVWDSEAVRSHPEWARGRPDGKPEDRQTSTFGPYVDLRMIPQIAEAAEKYDLDGAWVDGECWATGPDYNGTAAEAYRRASGRAELPKGPKDPGWLDFLEFNREQFRKYVRHYLDELHRLRPGFQIASNWMYTTFVPERPELPVDYLSGDYLGNSAISTARLEARYLSAAGRPWDLMAWGFQVRNGPGGGVIYKPAAQLMQESAVVLAQGGGFQVYYQPTRSGWLDDRLVTTMERVARFCRARQQWSHKSEAVPEIGVLLSKHSLYATQNKLFGGWGAGVNPARGMIDSLLACGWSVDVIPDWKLGEAASAYPLIVVPDWLDIGGAAQQQLAAYVRNGGKLLIAGADNVRRFAADCGIEIVGEAADAGAYVAGTETLANAGGRWQAIRAGKAKIVELRYANADTTRDSEPASFQASVGSGAVVGFCGPLGSLYATAHDPAIRAVVARLAAGTGFAPRVTVEGPPGVEVSLRRKAGRTLVHLANTTAMQVAAEYASIESIPPVGPLKLTVRLDARPAPVTLEPGGHQVGGTYANGSWKGTLDRLDIHSVLVFG